MMETGDTVVVRSTGRHARIVSELSNERFEVEYLPDPMSDPIDRDTVQSEGEGGIYAADDLEPLV
jgi:hypothetical protein